MDKKIQDKKDRAIMHFCKDLDKAVQRYTTKMIQLNADAEVSAPIVRSKTSKNKGHVKKPKK